MNPVHQKWLQRLETETQTTMGLSCPALCLASSQLKMEILSQTVSPSKRKSWRAKALSHVYCGGRVHLTVINEVGFVAEIGRKLQCSAVGIAVSSSPLRSKQRSLTIWQLFRSSVGCQSTGTGRRCVMCWREHEYSTNTV